MYWVRAVEPGGGFHHVCNGKQQPFSIKACIKGHLPIVKILLEAVKIAVDLCNPPASLEPASWIEIC